MVSVGGLLVVLVGLAHDEDVVAPGKGVRVHLHGVQVGVRVPPLGLPKQQQCGHMTQTGRPCHNIKRGVFQLYEDKGNVINRGYGINRGMYQQQKTCQNNRDMPATGAQVSNQE